MLSNKKMKDDWDKACETALSVGIDPAIVYAMAKTERIVSTTNKKLLEPEEIDEWNDAIDQFQAYTTKKQAKTMTWPEIKEMVEASRAAEEHDTPERLMEMALYALQACVAEERRRSREALTACWVCSPAIQVYLCLANC